MMIGLIAAIAAGLVVLILFVRRGKDAGAGADGSSGDIFSNTPLMSSSDFSSPVGNDAICEATDSGGWDSSDSDCSSDSGDSGSSD